VLYLRGGMLHKALDLAFKTQQFEVLQEIATQLDADSDPALIEKCAQYFITKEQFDKAVDLLAISKRVRRIFTTLNSVLVSLILALFLVLICKKTTQFINVVVPGCDTSLRRSQRTFNRRSD